MAKRTLKQKKQDKKVFILSVVLMSLMAFTVFISMGFLGMFGTNTREVNATTEKVQLFKHPTRHQKYIHILHHEQYLEHWTKAQYYAPYVIHNNHYISKVTGFMPLTHSHYVLVKFKPSAEKVLKAHKNTKKDRQINRSISNDDKKLQRISHDQGAQYVDRACL